jgi:hypothetical protein
MLRGHRISLTFGAVWLKMNFGVEISHDAMQAFPNLRVLSCEVKGVRVSGAHPRALEEFKERPVMM